MKYEILKSEDNFRNSFLADEDKMPDQVIASMSIDGKEFSGMGNDQEAAIEDLRERVNDHYSRLKHEAKLAIDKAIGLNFFE